MTIYVDNPRFHKVGYLKGMWCHMMTDGDLSELHNMANKVGLKRSWFQNHSRYPHYDMMMKKRNQALELGAIPVTSKEMLKICAGIRTERTLETKEPK